MKHMVLVALMMLALGACKPAEGLKDEDRNECRNEAVKEVQGTMSAKDVEHLAMCRKLEPLTFPIPTPGKS